MKLSILFLLISITIFPASSSTCPGEVRAGTFITNVWPTLDPDLIGFTYQNDYDQSINGTMILDVSINKLVESREHSEAPVKVIGLEPSKLYASYAINGTWYFTYTNKSIIISRPITIFDELIPDLPGLNSNHSLDAILNVTLQSAKYMVSKKLDLVFIAFKFGASFTLVKTSLVDSRYADTEINSILANVIWLQNDFPFIVFDEQSVIVTGRYQYCRPDGSWFLLPTFYKYNETSVGRLFTSSGDYYVRGDTNQIVFVDSSRDHGNRIGILDLGRLEISIFTVSSEVIEGGHKKYYEPDKLNPLLIYIGILFLIVVVSSTSKSKYFR